MGGSHKKVPQYGRKRVLRYVLRVVAVLVAFCVAYFLSEWLVTGAATLSIGKFLMTESIGGEF